MAKYSKTAEKLLPHLLQEMQVQPVIIAQAGGGGVMAEHALFGDYHSGTLDESQAPWAVTATVFGAHEADPDAHHNQATVVAPVVISGQQISLSYAAPLTVVAGALDVALGDGVEEASGSLRAKVPTNSGLVRDGSGLYLSPSTLTVATTNGVTGSGHTHAVDASSNPGATAKIVRTAADGSVTLESVTVNQSFYAAATAFRVINHTHDYPHAHVVINPGGSWTLDEQFGVDINDNLLVRGYIVGKHAIQLPGALLIAHYDGPEPYESNFKGEAVGHMGQVATVAGSVVYLPGKFGKAVQTGPTTTNLCTNPSFETNTTGWTYNDSNASGSMARSAYYSLFGAYSLQLYNATGGEDDYATFTLAGVAASTAYTITAYVRVTEFVSGAASNRGLYCYDSANAGATAQATTITALTDGWVRHSVTVTTTASPGSLVVRLYAPRGRVYWDAIQIEQKAYATGYADGDMPNHTWSGTAHASTSSRSTMAYLSYPTSGNINAIVGTVAAWVYPYSTGVNGTIFRLTGSTSGYVILRNSGTTLEAFWGTGAVSASVALTANTWQHLAITFDGATLRVYVNGTLATSGAAVGVTGLPANMYVGIADGVNGPFPGLIDDLVILDRAAAADEIRAVYESNAPVFAETSTWHWRSGRNRVWADAEGLWMLGASGSAVIGAYAGDDANPSATKSWGGATLSEGDVVIGHNQSGSAAMVLDRSAGKFQFVGGGSATVQAEIATDGQISAGGGAIKLGQYGARLLTGTSRATNLASTDGSRIMWLNSEIFEADEEEYSYLGTTYYRRSLVLRTVTTDTSFNFTSHVELAANNTTQDYASFVLEAGSQIEDYTPTYAINSLARIKADMVDFVATRVKMFDSTYGAWLEIYQGNTGKAVPVLKLSQSDLSEEFIEFAGTVATGNPINTDALGSYYGRVRVSVNGTFKWLALYN